MLIDRSYFVAQINIPNTEVAESGIGALLDQFINKYEPQFLRYVLGHELYMAFRAGISTMPIPQRFVDLISGVDYYDQGNQGFTWLGLAAAANVEGPLASVNPLFVTVGGPDQYDPHAGVVTTIPANLVGNAFTIEQRGFGTLNPKTEYTIVGNQLTLTNSVFSSGNVYVYRSAGLAFGTLPGIALDSPIANYVYYWFMRDNATQSTTMGEVSTSKENAISMGPGEKMSRAWNEMSQRVRQLAHFMNTKRDVYPEWTTNRLYTMLERMAPINEFNI
jgi:hypothetical protein